MKLVILLTLLSFNAEAVTKVCLAGSTVKIFKSYGQSFINGAKLAVMNNKDFEVKEYFYDRSPLAAREATKKMIAENCNVIMGYSNINELNQAKDLVIKNKVPVISIYSNLKDEDSKVNILTMQPKAEFMVDKVNKYLKKNKQKLGTTLMVTAANISSFQDYKSAFSKMISSESGTVVNYDLLENKFNKDILLKKIKNTRKKIDTVILLTRSVVASKVVNALTELKQKPFVIGTSNFGSTTLPAFYNGLKDKDVNGMFVRQHSVMDRDPSYKAFNKLYKKTFKSNPMVISGYAYDAINYLKKNKKDHMGVTGVHFASNFTTKTEKCFYVLVNKNGHSLAKGSDRCLP